LPALFKKDADKTTFCTPFVGMASAAYFLHPGMTPAPRSPPRLTDAGEACALRDTLLLELSNA
jgi:hypothetical protein